MAQSKKTEPQNLTQLTNRLIAENEFLRVQNQSLESKLKEAVDLLHIWKNNAHAYRLKAQMVLVANGQKDNSLFNQESGHQ
ncbi:hypothetical protein MLD52_19565 [Puniceicoccaceae bacterium K14]|nr:hypothetical protein [Puniceicoccaceae bacterium K14]